MNYSDCTILIVDDDPPLIFSLSMLLEIEGFKVLTAPSGVQGLEVLRQNQVDLIISDVAMPYMNGYKFFQEVIQNPQWAGLPFIFLTARNLDSDIIYGKELGIDDYLIKPVERAELLATIKGKLKLSQRRAELATSAPPTIKQAGSFDLLRLGSLEIDPVQHRVWKDGDLIPLSAREFRLLLHLARHPHAPVSVSELIQSTHQFNGETADREVRSGDLIRPLIRSLRRKLGYPAGDLGCIEAVRGVGYRLITPV